MNKWLCIFAVLCQLGCNNCNNSIDQLDASCNEPDVISTDVELTDSEYNYVDSERIYEFYDSLDWSLKINAGWESLSVPPSELELFLRHKYFEAAIILKKEKYSNSLEQYTIETMRGFRSQGATLLSTIFYEDNQKKYSIIVSSKKYDDNTIINYSLLRIHNGHGYSLDCGGAEDKVTLEMCNSVFENFILK